ncbi:hypothetical protein K2Y11_04135 [bacterium]|nr:hypothetical protein [bacterium]
MAESMNPDDEIRSTDAAARASDSIDSDDSSQPVDSSLSADDRRMIADHLLMNALLIRTLSPPPAGDQALLNDVLYQLDRPVSSRKQLATKVVSAGRRWLISSLSIAAGLAAVVSLWFVTEANTPSALAAVEQARIEARRPIDRHYQIKLDLPAIKSLDADLYLRGDDRLALHLAGPLDVSAWLGINGDEAWFVPRIGPAIVTKDVDRMQERLEDLASMPIPMLNITRVLDTIERDYELTLASDHSAQEFVDGQVLQHVRAVKRSGFRPLLPERIEFWSQPDSGVIVRMTLVWTELVDKLAVRRVEFLLADQKTQETDLYEHSGHHAPEFPVLRLDGIPAGKK